MKKKIKSIIIFFTDVAELDITDKNAITAYFESKLIDIVVNCAAYTNVDKSEEDKENADLINHIGPKNIAEVCKDRDGLIIHISTDYVFDGSKNAPYVETDETKPLGVYGETKLRGENVIINSGCQYIIIRTS